MESDTLRSIRNSYYLGFYQQAKDEASELRHDSHTDISRYATIYYYRSLIHINPQEVIQHIQSNDSTALLTLQQYARYMIACDRNNPTDRHDIINELEKYVDHDSVDLTLSIHLSILYFNEGNYKDALKILALGNHNNNNLEKIFLSVQIYLSIHRLDLALKAYKSMQEIDDDDTLSQLAAAYIHNYQGDKQSVNTALNEYQELIDKFGSSVIALNGIALSYIQLHEYTQALNSLKEAKKQSEQENQLYKNTKKTHSDTLVNSIIGFKYLNKSSIVQQIQNELKQQYPVHPYFTLQEQYNDVFSKAAENYRIKA